MPTPARVIPFARPVLGDAEKNIAAEVLNGHVLVHGPRIHDFEHAFAVWTKSPGAVALSSCTAGLHLAYFGRGLTAGDEVIVPAMTHVATAHAVELVGAKPVFVDAESETGNIDIEQIEAAITPRTKALSVVHYLGMPVDMDRINAIAKKYDLFVVEDCALAIGSYFKGVHAGLLGDIGLFSFYPVKHMTTLEGGMAISKHADVLTRMTRERAFGVDRTHRERAIAGQYDVTCLGFNYRMNELQAAVGIEQVKRLDSFLAARRANYDAIAAGLRDVPEVSLLESTHGDFVSSYYCQSITLNGTLSAKRFEFTEAMTAAGIGTSIYYPRPVPEFTYYRQKYGFEEGRFPNAARIANQSVALPVGPHLQPGDAGYIAEAVKETIIKLK